jgi:hypothetical protein
MNNHPFYLLEDQMQVGKHSRIHLRTIDDPTLDPKDTASSIDLSLSDSFSRSCQIFGIA